MKLKQEFIIHDTEDESLLIPVGGASFFGLVKGNKTLGAILDLLREETTEADVVAAMRAQFDAPEEKIAADVKKAITKLREIGAIDG